MVASHSSPLAAYLTLCLKRQLSDPLGFSQALLNHICQKNRCQSFVGFLLTYLHNQEFIPKFLMEMFFKAVKQIIGQYISAVTGLAHPCLEIPLCQVCTQSVHPPVGRSTENIYFRTQEIRVMNLSLFVYLFIYLFIFIYFLPLPTGRSLKLKLECPFMPL